MLVKKILHKELLAFLASEAYQKSRFLPISKHRGLSHTKNPRALPEDLVLVMVFENDEMLGYLGVLPDNLYFLGTNGEYQQEHVGWLSCMWVNPELRGKGIAKILINTVFEAWQHRILVTEFTPAAKGLYDRTAQFIDLAKPLGLRAYLRLNLAYLLPAKNRERWEKFSGLLKFADRFFNFFNSIRLSLIACPEQNFSYIPEIDEETWQFIQQHRGANELMRRKDADLRWLVNNPWLLSGAIEDEAAKRYHFSSIATHFSFLNIKVHNKEGALVAFLILSLRDKNMKIPYCYIAPGAVATVAKVVEQHLRELKMDMLTVFHPELVAYWQKEKGSFFMRRKMQRHYIISKVFDSLLQKQGAVIIQDGDADAAFT
jgi:GNAT superfamily N-acetyltransferase